MLPRLGIITMVAPAGGLLKKFVEERCLGKKSVARPPAYENDGVDGDFSKIHFHHWYPLCEVPSGVEHFHMSCRPITGVDGSFWW